MCTQKRSVHRNLEKEEKEVRTRKVVVRYDVVIKGYLFVVAAPQETLCFQSYRSKRACNTYKKTGAMG